MRTWFSAVDRMAQALTFHRERHAVLSGNLANVDTPGYRPVDLERVSGAGTTGLPLRRTSAAHMAAGGLAPDTRVVDSGSASVGADGNAVNLERELAKIDANRVRYAAVSELVSRKIALLRYAAGDGIG